MEVLIELSSEEKVKRIKARIPFHIYIRTIFGGLRVGYVIEFIKTYERGDNVVIVCKMKGDHEEDFFLDDIYQEIL